MLESGQTAGGPATIFLGLIWADLEGQFHGKARFPRKLDMRGSTGSGVQGFHSLK